MLKIGSDNTKILLAGGGDKSLDDLMTTNTIQYLNPTGTKNFYTEGGTQYYHNSLWIRGNNEGAAISFVDNGVAQIRFTQDNFYFTSSGGTNMIPIHAGGFIKEGYNNEFILLAGGDAKLISDFVASKIINGSYNANNLSTNSITYGYSVANAPTSASSHSFTTLNLDTADPNFKMQIGFDGDTNEMFSRTKSAGNWNDWVKYATTSQLSNYLPLTVFAWGTLTDHLTIERPNGSSLGVTSHHLALTAANFDYTGFAMFIPSSNVIEILIGNSIAWGTIKLQPYGGQLFYGNNEVATVNQFQNYYTQGQSLNLFVGLNGVQTIYDTKTFNSSPVIPNGTLGNHAVNLNQLNNKVTNEDSVRGVAFDSGLSTGVPYFIHSNGTYVPMATQSWVSSNYISTSHIANTITLTNIQQWNYMAQYGLQLNSDFTVNTGSGLLIADDYFGGESGMIDRSYDRFVSAKQEGYYKYGSRYGTFDGLNFNFESRLFGMGRESNKEDKLTVEGSVKASKNFKSEDERPDTIFIPNGNVASLKDEIVNDESEYAIRLDPHEYEIDPSGYLDVDDRNRLIHIIGEQVKMVVNFKEIYPKQQIVIYNFDKSGGAMTVKIYGKNIYNIEPGSFLRLYVTRSRRVIAERQLPCEFVW